jgi:hypothetical protein
MWPGDRSKAREEKDFFFEKKKQKDHVEPIGACDGTKEKGRGTR